MRLGRVRPAALAGALVVLLLLVGGGGVQGTFALFTDPASVQAGTASVPNTAFTSGGIARPVTPTAAAATGSVQISWTAATAGIGTADRYEIVRYAAPAGGAGTVVCTTSAVSCTDTSPAVGAAWYAVRARVGASWTNEGDRVAHNPDTSGPTVTITTPLTTCSGTRVACGTATDPSGVALVEYSFKRRESYGFLGSLYQCWNGSAWGSDVSAGTACAYAPTTGTPAAWTVPGVRSTAYASVLFATESYVLTIRATDALGNVTITDQAFVL